MNREKYIILRGVGNNIEILYEAAKEFGSYKESLYHFSNMYITWTRFPQVQQHFIQKVVDHYDKKFNLTLVYYKEKIIKIV